MSWYTSKWWRFAVAPASDSTVSDSDGRWKHLVGSIWVLVERGT